MDKLYCKLQKLFREANNKFLKQDQSLLVSKVSERTLCGALLIHLWKELQVSAYKEYFVDVEYNRNEGGKIKTIKTIYGTGERVITINCDLIVHSRGRCATQDNLIAIEMKKHSRPNKEKLSDKERLSCLTKDSFDNVWSFDGKSLPEHVCRYKLGIYYEVNNKKNKVNLEYYYKGNMVGQQTIILTV